MAEAQTNTGMSDSFMKKDWKIERKKKKLARNKNYYKEDSDRERDKGI